MKLVDALETLKAKGIVKLTGLCGQTDIDKYIENTRRGNEDAQRWSEQSWAKYHTEHIDDHYIVETNGHHIIVTKYDGFDMATYGDYATKEEMYADFNEWKILLNANSIADEMIIKRPGEFPREAWFLIAVSELRAADKAATEAFEREYGSANKE